MDASIDYSSQSQRTPVAQQYKMDLKKQLEEDLFIIGKIEVEDDGLLSYNDFDRLFRIIQKHATFRVANELECDAEMRLKFLQENGLHAAQNQTYREMALKSIRREELVYMELSQDVCEAVGLDYDVF